VETEPIAQKDEKMKTTVKIAAVLGLLVLCGSVWAQDSGLIAYWEFDEGSGTTAYDSAGNNDGAIYGATWTIGQVGGALSFDGVDDYVDCGNDESLDFTDAITIGAWVKRPNFDTGGVIAGKTNGNSVTAGYGLYSYPDGLLFSFYSGGWRRTTPRVTIPANQWHHVVGTFDGNNAYLYVDGQQKASLAHTGTIAAATGYSFHISYWRPALPVYFNGTIDDVMVFDRSLSPEEIQQLYQSGFPDVVALEITGPEQVRENYQAQYKALAYYDNGQTSDVTDLALWWVEPNTIASIEAGLLHTNDLDTNRYITIYAQYSERGFTVNAEKTVQVSLPVEIEIIGPERVRGNYQTQYKVLAYYDEGPTRDVTDLALWEVEPDSVATIEAGLLQTKEIYQQQDITIYVAYTGLETQMTVQVLATPYIWYVPADYETIQAAIDAAIYGDVVLVADGTYTGPGNRDIDFLGKAITVKSESGPENCIIDCNGTEIDPHRGFYFHNGEDANSILDGFTITNGYSYGSSWSDRFGGGINCTGSSPTITNCTINGNSARDGGGIYCEWESNPTITNCTISGNSAGHGGGIYCLRQSNPTITNCTINGNSAGHGGGIYCSIFGSPTINNCIISGNSARYYGGGIFCWEGSQMISNCTITDNEAKWGDGGGICCWGSSPTITNCTISRNSAEDGGGIYSSYSSSPTITNCTISGNSGVRDGLAPGSGGGIYCEDSNAVITRCTISGNLSDNGGGIACFDSDPTIKNCTISGNSATGGGGIFCWYGSPNITNCTISGNFDPRGGGISSWESDLAITNCILWNNTDSEIEDSAVVSYSDIRGGWPGEGNINVDPCFVEPGYWADANDPNIIVEPNDPNAIWIGGDYHLLRTSPCVDAGTDANVYTDIEGNVRPFDFPGVDNNDELPEFDMGAYELVPVEAEMKLTPQTLNCASKGNCIKAHITLPEGFLPQDVDVNEPAVAEPMGIESEYIKVFGNDDGHIRLEICFDHEAFCDSVTETGEIEITVIGSLTTSRYFYASDTIKIKPRR